MNKTLTACGLALTLGATHATAAEIAMIELSGTPLEQPSPFAWLLGDTEPTLLETVRIFDEIADDPDIDAVVIRVKDAALGYTQIEEIGAAIQRVRDEGKKVHVFAENYQAQELMLGTHADETIIQAGGGVFFSGLRIEEMFLADTLEWLGLKADYIQVGDYKGANEMLTRSEPSDTWRESINTLLDGMWSNITSDLATGYDLSDSELNEALRAIWFADAEQAHDAGVITSVVDLADLESHLESQYGSSIEWDMSYEPDSGPDIDMSNPFAMLQILSSEPDHQAKRDTIAVLHIEGVIVDGDSTPETAFSSASTGSRTIRNAIEEIIEQDLIKGVVVRIDSPGGSAIASEVIWRGLQRLQEHKPVWVSVGSMAASGGYYIAVGGDRIHVNPTSIVGSIGVVGGKISMGGLYDKLKINTASHTRGPMADMFSTAEPWNEQQIAAVRQRMVDTYELFTKRVSQGREGINLSRTAEGRLFAGSAAVDLAMADQVAGLDETLEQLADHAGLRRYEVMHFPGPKSLDALFEDMFGGFIQSPQPSGLASLAETIRATLGEDQWLAIRDGIAPVMLLRDEPVLLTLPRTIIVR